MLRDFKLAEGQVEVSSDASVLLLLLSGVLTKDFVKWADVMCTGQRNSVADIIDHSKGIR